MWDWTAEDRYRLHMYVTFEEAGAWRCLHFVSEYRAVLRAEMEAALAGAGLEGVRWLEAEETGFYQPVVLGRR